VQNPKKAASLERGQASVALKTPGASPGSGNVGSTSGRKGERGSNREAGSKASAGERLEGAKTQEGKVRRSSLRWRLSFPFPSGDNL